MHTNEYQVRSTSPTFGLFDTYERYYISLYCKVRNGHVIVPGLFCMFFFAKPNQPTCTTLINIYSPPVILKHIIPLRPSLATFIYYYPAPPPLPNQPLTL